MYLKPISVFLGALLVASVTASLGGYISNADQKKLFSVLVKSLVLEPNDVTSAYYAAKGFNLLKEPIVDVLKRDNCAHLQAGFEEGNTPQDTFQTLSALSLLGCNTKLPNDPNVGVVKTLQELLKTNEATTTDIRYALETLKLLGQNVPNPQKIAQLLEGRLKTDASLLNWAHTLHAAALLGPQGKFALDIVPKIVQNADETDGKALYWEGGLVSTSVVLTGLFRLPGAKPLTDIQADKVGNYLVSRKTVKSPKGALALIEAVVALANSDVSPLSIFISGPPSVTPTNPDLNIRVTDIIERAPKQLPDTIIAQSATRIADDVVVLSKQALKPGQNRGEYILTLKLEPGHYRIVLAAGKQSVTLVASVLGTVAVSELEIGVSDADAVPKLTKLSYPEKLSKALQADSSQNLVVKFPLSRAVQQTFLRLSKGNREIIFVAEPDNRLIYKIEVNLVNELSQSGTFDIELILGDSLMLNPLRWSLGEIEVNLNIPDEEIKPIRTVKPEIQHLFRKPENRPPEVVSLLFTALTLSPLLLLLGLWAKLGINLSNFSVLSLPFYGGFGGILGLYTLFWLRLDMFTTCAWLIPIGAFTFLAGQKLLSRIARQKK